MLKYFQRRRQLKRLRLLLRAARHIQNWQGDILPPQAGQLLEEQLQQATQAAAAGDAAVLAQATQELKKTIQKLAPPRPHALWRENIEVLIVALAVAMAFRTYFIQPFKIPTASMAPTLCGIRYMPQEQPALSDRFPLNLAKWVIFGQWYVEVRAQTTGLVRLAQDQDDRIMVINGVYHLINKNMTTHVAAGEQVVRGQLLASGVRVSGDHIFVDKLRWNFIQPRRGEIMVFRTNGIHHPQIKTNEHYVKRIVGLPNELLQIQPPDLLINEHKITACPAIARVASQQQGYDGYQRGGRDNLLASYLSQVDNAVHLKQDQYFACGDNQFNSLDSRYWGPVSKQNLVGATIFVYWPFSRHWGIAN